MTTDEENNVPNTGNADNTDDTGDVPTNSGARTQSTSRGIFFRDRRAAGVLSRFFSLARTWDH